MRKAFDVSLVIFWIGVICLLASFVISIRKDKEMSEYKAKVEKQALDKYQKVFQMCEANMKTIARCDDQYGALIKLWEQVNKDCDQNEFDIAKVKERLRILSHNDKILEKRGDKLERRIGSKSVDVRIIDSSEASKVSQ